MDDPIAVGLQVMMAKIIFVSFLLNPLFTTAQQRIPTVVFHRDNQVCHFTWVTQQDYILKLFPDSTISILIFEKNYRGYRSGNNSMTKLEYTGRFIVVGDTLKINYLSQHYEIKFEKQNTFNKIKHKESNRDASPGIGFKPKIYVASEFILKDGVATALYYSYPSLRVSSITEEFFLESEFNSWDRSYAVKYKSSFN